MTRRRLEGLFWATAMVFAFLTWRRVGRAVPTPEGTQLGGLPTVRTIPSRMTATAVNSAARSVASRDPLRLARSPASVRFGAPPVTTDPLGDPPLPKPIQPTLAVAGIMGPPWQALLEGIPGRPTAIVVRAGDRIEDFRIVSITHDRVVVQNADTTWRLSLKRSWQ